MMGTAIFPIKALKKIYYFFRALFVLSVLFYALIDGRSYIIRDMLSQFRSGWKKDQVQLHKSDIGSMISLQRCQVPGDRLIPSTYCQGFHLTWQ